ncbi:hypothetical protein Tco_0782547 [Tanacetum coccineum]
MPEDPYAYIMAAYEVPPSPDYIPGPEVPPSPDYIPGPEVPPSPDYIPGPEEPQSPPPLDFVPEPMYPEYIPQEDEILPAEEQPLPAAASPTADSPGYVPESDPEEEPEEDDEDPEEDPADYPADRDDDDDDEDEDDDEEEEEHPALADSVPPIHRMTAKTSIRDEPSISLPPREEVERLLALTTPPPSPLTPLSSPLPHIPSPPLPASPPLQLLSSDHRTDRPEITLPPQKRLGIDLGPRYEIGENSAAATTKPIGGRRADYGFVDPREAVEEVAPMTLRGVNDRVTGLTAVQEQDTQDIYVVIEDTQDRQTQIYQSVGTLIDDKIMALRSVVMGQQVVISQLQAADCNMFSCDLKKMAPKRRTTSTEQLGIGIIPTSEWCQKACAVARECTYPDFLKCQPLNFRAYEGVQGNALNGGTPKIRPLLLSSPIQCHGEGYNVVTYSQRFPRHGTNELSMYPEEIDQVEKKTVGLLCPTRSMGSVMQLTKNYAGSIEFATELNVTRRSSTWAECRLQQKKVLKTTARNNQNQHPNKNKTLESLCCRKVVT